MFVDISNITGVPNTDFAQFIVDIINWAIGFAAVLSVVMIISSGFQYILSFGDEKKISRATSSLIFAIIGMVLVFLAPTVIQFILDNFLGK
ncbi:hypothetical protein A3K02_00690 [candidate division WS6 bacterium RIFOXYD1_FULL_33_8]|uniref:Uncharacterized protein n=2 Tax=Candidatus Dojkabacteria TaxID=74243 RepID=A0A0G0AVH5_9BACT|nr:MAG: hypothetical protein UR34_C0009G0017 [candidate division WS6 bacterium GW2011_GWC1_33_20]KKP45896.1 MAG: hypothetical protein UR36_C0003G0051 [candidate division WS6 bacterium GW2011_GWF1_33_233]KKP55108.1 MAG: hypothetical protein UR45_C0004G0003 [candidate division WS6 bacterium GW2011_WS6_33_547]KKP55356.1 MAG: hypothetical protein UR47_C0002G0073 [candidate division WS6 bacterium GW2011_GWB1_33_6]KKP56274.1 MAG: hypothetical protein UR49_C0016G0005 [candidate division WS6 bacterium 